MSRLIKHTVFEGDDGSLRLFSNRDGLWLHLDGRTGGCSGRSQRREVQLLLSPTAAAELAAALAGLTDCLVK